VSLTSTQDGGHDIDYKRPAPTHPGRSLALTWCIDRGTSTRPITSRPHHRHSRRSTSRSSDTFHSLVDACAPRPRQRNHDNQSSGTRYASGGFRDRSGAESQAFVLMDWWLSRSRRIRAPDSPRRSSTQPADAVDRLHQTGTGIPGPCVHSAERICRVWVRASRHRRHREVSAQSMNSTTSRTLFTDAQWHASLQQAFPVECADTPSRKSQPTRGRG